MNTLEAIITEAENMPEPDQKKILFFIKNIKTQHLNPFTPVTEENVLADLEISEKQYREGNCQDLETAVMNAGKQPAHFAWKLAIVSLLKPQWYIRFPDLR